MTPYAEHLIPKESRVLFGQIKAAVTTMKDPDLGLDEDGERITLSCHMLARAVARVFHAPVRDGYFSHELYEHSWNLTPQGYIVDSLPVHAVGGPIMLNNGRYSPYSRLYKSQATKMVSRGRFAEHSFYRSVRRIARALRETQTQ